jgi:crotonobetainyl-CoA:carnitine CoA-transferase CaiB-like acyl-CoA transferase
MVMSISGIEGEAPLKHGGFQAQYQGGLFGAAATSMALFAQSNTGIGEHVDVSIVECLASTMMATQTIYPFVGATQARRRSEGDAFSNPMPCKDGWIIVQAGGGATWEDLANFFDAPELLEPRFAEPGQRSDNGVEMDEIIINSIKDRGKWELFTKAADARMLFGLVQTPSELVDCPQLKSRDFFREIHHPVMGDMIVPAELFKLSETPYQLHKSSPTLGQHNHEIYVEGLGYSTEEFCQLRQLNVI